MGVICDRAADGGCSGKLTQFGLIALCAWHLDDLRRAVARVRSRAKLARQIAVGCRLGDVSIVSARPVNWTLETWPIAQLAAAVRHDVDDAKVAGLVQSLANGGELPPIFVLVDGGKAVILDGHHRVAAWVIARVPDAPVLVGRPR